MGKKILLSPIGGTDPIKYFHDGSMLHICRHYKPDVVYLYLSHEMLRFHRQDNRYVNAIKHLERLLNHSFEVKVIEKDNWVDVQRYDEFYTEFREEIKKIQRDMGEEDELILNIASGTPSMKSALLILATLGEYRFTPVQVVTPKRQINSEHEDRNEYEPEMMWELNEDNEENHINRCEEVKCLNLMTLLKLQIIEKHIDAYDYTAALAVAEEIKDKISEEAYRLLQIADARVKLNRNEISKRTQNQAYQIFPIGEGDKQKIFEYALVLQIKWKKQEYADLLRGITPLIVDLLENILKNMFHISVDDCCSKDKNGIRIWDWEKLKRARLWDALNKAYTDQGGFRGRNVYSDHLIKIIRDQNKQCAQRGSQYDKEMNKHLDRISVVEKKARNTTAHEIVSVTEDWIRKETGYSIKDIFDTIKYLVRKSGINATAKDWNSYDEMNSRLHQSLQ